MSTPFENKLIDQGFADTRAPKLAEAVDRLHSAISYMDSFNITLLKKHYPEAITLARKLGYCDSVSNKFEDDIYY